MPRSVLTQLFVAVLAGMWLAVSAEPGTLLWKKEIDGGLPTLMNNELFGDYLMVKTGNATVDVFHAWTGADVGSIPLTNAMQSLNAVGANKEYLCVVYTGDTNFHTHLSCLRFSDGKLTIAGKVIQVQDEGASLNLEAEGRVVIAGFQTALVMRLDDGVEVANITGETVISGGGAIYVTRLDKNFNLMLAKIDIATGTQLWARDVSMLWPELVCASDEVIVATFGIGGIIGYEPGNNGTKKFSFKVNNSAGESYDSGSCSNGALVFGFGFEEKQVYVVSVSNVTHPIVVNGTIKTVTVDTESRRIITSRIPPNHNRGSPYVQGLSLDDGKEVWKRSVPLSGPVTIVGSQLIAPNPIGCNFISVEHGDMPGVDTELGQARFGFLRGANIVAGSAPGTPKGQQKKPVLFNFAHGDAGKAELSAIEFQ